MSPRSASWLDDEDPRTLRVRVERVLVAVRDKSASACPGCGETVCGHMVVFSLAAGFDDAPRCLTCLGRAIGRDPETTRDQLAGFVLAKPCLEQGWRMAGLREGFSGKGPPACLWPRGGTIPEPDAAPAPAPPTDPATADATWDAGELACGELVLDLRRRMERMPAGAVLRVVALDPAAPEDLPAWCRLTGHELLAARHPEYLIKRKD